MRPTALIRRPGARLAEGLVTHIERVPVDPALAHRQWEAYVVALESAGWDLVEVPPADDCPDAVGYAPLVDDDAVFDRFRPVPEESGAHVVLLSDGKLLMAADAPRSAALFAELGYEPVTVDISELQKLEGCVACLSVRLRARA